MQIVPILAQPSQVVQAILGGQSCRLHIHQTNVGLYMDVYVNDVLIIGGVTCENENRVVHSKYLGFIGDLAFFDTAGKDNPNYKGLGTRWLLLYLSPSDIGQPRFDVEAFVPLPAGLGLVAVGSASSIITSNDAKNWVQRTTSESNSWEDVCYASDIKTFAAIASDGVNRAMTSKNTVDWIVHPMPVNNSWRTIARAPALGLFVALSFDGTHRSATSVDGENWLMNIDAVADAGFWHTVKWFPEIELFIAVGESGGVGGPVGMKSPDGRIWTNISSGMTNDKYFGLAYSPQLNRLVAISPNSTNHAIHTDASFGISWLGWVDDVLSLGSVVNCAYSPTARVAGRFAVLGPSGAATVRAQYSNDGNSWLNPAVINPTSNWQGLIWTPSLGLFVGCSLDGGVSHIATSPDGITYTPRTTPDLPLVRLASAS